MISQQVFMTTMWKKNLPQKTLNEDDHAVNLKTIAERQIKSIGIWFGHYHDQVHIIAKILSFILLITCIAQAVSLFLSLHDMKSFIDCFSILTFCSMGLLKLASLRSNMIKWQKLLTLVSDTEEIEKERTNISDVEYESEDENEKTDDKIKADYTKKIQDIGSGLPLVYWITAAVFILAPFAEFTLIWFRGLPTSYPHILPVWTPFGDNLKTYPFVIILEFVGAIYCVSVHLAFDITSVGLMVFLVGQLSSLRVNMQRIGGKGKSCFLSRKRNRRAHERIVKCHRHHCALIKINRSLDSILKPIMGVYINLSTLTLCATAVQLTPDLSKVQKLSLIQYMFASLVQLFLFCHYGDSVLHASDMASTDGAFAASWWCLDGHTRKDLLILAIGLSRPLYLKAGWFHSLNRPAFLSILRTAYSFYTVLSETRQ